MENGLLPKWPAYVGQDEGGKKKQRDFFLNEGIQPLSSEKKLHLFCDCSMSLRFSFTLYKAM